MSKALNKIEFLWHHKTKHSCQYVRTLRNLLLLIISPKCDIIPARVKVAHASSFSQIELTHLLLQRKQNIWRKWQQFKLQFFTGEKEK